ncbi:hypothetical protein UlMin_009137 [Ulmus minor]
MVAIIIASILVRCVSAAATNHTVGGTSGWDLSSNLQGWVNQNTFHVGDSLLFSYLPVHDVVEVNQVDYQLCDSSHPIQTHNEGETLIPLTSPGSRFFICGQKGHCGMGLKLQIQILPHQNDTVNSSPSQSPASNSDPAHIGIRPSTPIVDINLHPHHRTCGASQEIAALFLWLLPLIATLILIVFSFHPGELGYCLAISHL